MAFILAMFFFFVLQLAVEVGPHRFPPSLEQCFWLEGNVAGAIGSHLWVHGGMVSGTGKEDRDKGQRKGQQQLYPSGGERPEAGSP